MIRMNYNKQFNAPRYVELFSTSCLLLLTELSELRRQGGGGDQLKVLTDQLTLPYLNQEANYAHHITTPPSPVFSDFPTALLLYHR